MTTIKPRSMIVPLGGLLLCSFSGWSSAQMGNQPSASVIVSEQSLSQPVDNAQSPITLESELGWLLTRGSILDLRLHEAPSPEDYAMSANLLSLASDIEPGNAEIARAMAQAAWLAGDESLMIRATRRVIKIDPKDSVAMLRLISSIINQEQTIEGRLALYERFLGDRGGAIDPAVRSRLALDAALLEREAGNSRGFLERLHQATRLDVSNKAAASLAAQYYASVRSDPVTNLDYQIRLLRADPLDANVHMTIARMLASEGAYLPAQRFLTNAKTLFSLESGRAPSNVEEVRVALDWQIEGPEKVMHTLNATLNDRRSEARARIEYNEEQEIPTDDLIKPEEIRYEIGIDKLRLLGAHSIGDAEQTRAVLDDITGTVNNDLISIGKLLEQRGVDVNALLAQVVVKIADLQSMRAIVGLDSEKIREDLDEVLKTQPAMAERLAGIEPMALFAEGKYEESLELANRFTGSPIINLIRGQCLEKLGRIDEAVEIYSQIAHFNALNAYGAFAHSRLTELGKDGSLLTPAGRQMSQIAETVPDWMDQMIIRPRSFMFLSIEPEKKIYQGGERAMLTLRLQNTAPIPLAVGPSAPIDSRFLLDAVGVKTTNNGFVGTPRPKVLSLDQRVRLEPREEIRVQIAADSMTTDWLIGIQPGVSMRQRWRLLQGFRPRVSDEIANQANADPNAKAFGITNSPLGLTAETRAVQRLSLRTLSLPFDDLIARITDPDPAIRRNTMLAVASKLMLSDDSPWTPEQVRRVVEALNEAFDSAKTGERAAMMLVLPQRHQVPGMIDFDDHVATSILSDSLIDSTVDPVVLSVALLTRTDDAQAPIFETLSQVSDERVLTIAALVRDRLRVGAPMISTIGPGVDAMTPEFDGLPY